MATHAPSDGSRRMVATARARVRGWSDGPETAPLPAGSSALPRYRSPPPHSAKLAIATPVPTVGGGRVAVVQGRGARPGAGGRLCHRNGPVPTRFDHAVMALAPGWSTERQAGAVVGAGGMADTDQTAVPLRAFWEVNRHDGAGEKRGPLLDALMVFARRVLSMSCLAEIAPERSFGWLPLFACNFSLLCWWAH